MVLLAVSGEIRKDSAVDSLKRFLGYDPDGRGVSLGTSLLWSLVLSLVVSTIVRALFPGAGPVLRIVVFFAIAYLVFRWIDRNRSASRGERRPPQ
ncbi:Uncharacterised protein [Jonesia denitrificans]|nr:Uncharacterised protein [Jonesia denitrificans]